MYKLNEVYVSPALDFLNALYKTGIRVDLTVTSPPYNKCRSAHLESLSESRKLKYEIDDELSDDCMDEEGYQFYQIEVLNAIYAITNDGGALFYNHRVRYVNGKAIHPMEWILKTNWRLYQEIIWDKNIILNPSTNRFYHTDERIFWLQKGTFSRNLSKEAAGWKTVWRITERVPDYAKEHPAPFRPSIPRRIIAAFLGDRDGVVLDPYCGVGTALIEAKKLGKQYIGCDISEKYIKIAKQNLALTPDPIIK